MAAPQSFISESSFWDESKTARKKGEMSVTEGLSFLRSQRIRGKHPGRVYRPHLATPFYSKSRTRCWTHNASIVTGPGVQISRAARLLSTATASAATTVQTLDSEISPPSLSPPREVELASPSSSPSVTISLTRTAFLKIDESLTELVVIRINSRLY